MLTKIKNNQGPKPNTFRCHFCCRLIKCNIRGQLLPINSIINIHIYIRGRWFIWYNISLLIPRQCPLHDTDNSNLQKTSHLDSKSTQFSGSKQSNTYGNFFFLQGKHALINIDYICINSNWLCFMNSLVYLKNFTRY